MWLKTCEGILVNADRMDAIRIMDVKKTGRFEVQIVKSDANGEWVVFLAASAKNLQSAEKAVTALNVMLNSQLEVSPEDWQIMFDTMLQHEDFN